MSFIISQTGVGRLPTELVKNAAFIKHIDFDPVHQTDETDQYAEKISGNSSRFEFRSVQRLLLMPRIYFFRILKRIFLSSRNHPLLI